MYGFNTIKSAVTRTIEQAHTKLLLIIATVFVSVDAYALKTLNFEIPGAETDDGNPIEFTGNLIGIIVTLALGALGLFLIVMIIVQLLKDIGQAREDGKWLNVAKTALFSICLLIFVGWLISLALGLI